MDDYFRMKASISDKILKSDLYIIGLVCLFIASKLEDTKPIKLEQIIVEAGHMRFSQEEVLVVEKDILRTLNYRLYKTSVL